MTLIYVAFAWIAGIVLGENAPGSPPLSWIAAAGLAGIGALIFRRDKALRLLLVCIAAGALGGLRMNAVNAAPGPDALSSYNGSGWRTFEGVIVDAPDVRDRFVNLYIAVDAAVDPEHNERETIRGTALVQAARYGDYAYGDRVQVAGTPLIPPEFDDFSYRDYLARRGVHTLIPNAEVTVLSRGNGDPFVGALLQLRGRAQQVIADALPEPQASLLMGILLGVETGISTDVREAFNATGSAHIIAISGFNMILIAGLLNRIAETFLTKKRAAAVTIPALIVYTLFVGASPSVVRAAVMSILLLAAPLLNRRVYTPASLAFAALIMSLLDPFVLWDVGFQLSFAAVLGLALFVNPIEKAFRRVFTHLFKAETAERLLRILSEPLIVSLAAQITTLPLVALYFGRASASSFAVNLLILPVQSPILILGGLATLIGLLLAPLAQPIFWAAWLFLAWTVEVVRFFARLPGASFTVQVDERMVAVFFLGLLTWMILRGTRPAWLGKIRPFLAGQGLAVAAMGAGFVTAVVLWIAAAQQPDGLLHVSFLDSGSSNAVLIETPAGSQILIDGGRYPTRLLTALGDHLPFWDREIELLVLTQPKDAQFAAIPAVLERYTVDQVLTNGQGSESESFQALQRTLAERAIPTLPVTAGFSVETSDGVRLEVLHPQATPDAESEPEEVGLVIRLTYGEVSFLLTPDLDEHAETALLESGLWLHGTILQLPTHGAARVSGEDFLAAVGAQAAVAQVDPGNRSGHPSPEVIARLGDVPLYRTDEQGEIGFTTDGQRLWVSAGAQ